VVHHLNKWKPLGQQPASGAGAGPVGRKAHGSDAVERLAGFGIPHLHLRLIDGGRSTVGGWSQHIVDATRLLIELIPGEIA
jgi:hypothetical protein